MMLRSLRRQLVAQPTRLVVLIRSNPGAVMDVEQLLPCDRCALSLFHGTQMELPVGDNHSGPSGVAILSSSNLSILPLIQPR